MKSKLFNQFKKGGTYMLASAMLLHGITSAQVTGPGSSQSPYLTPVIPGLNLTSIISVGDSTSSGYKMCGIPDGLGAYDNGDGTFTLLANHEIGNTLGVVRGHGSIGAFVSKWVINKSDLSIVSGSDLMQNVNLWNGSSYTVYNTSNPSSAAAFSRFCSGDLPMTSAFYNSVTGNGSESRIFMNGEESGTEGRAMAHIVTGANAGSSYQLTEMGKMSFENVVANPYKSDKTIVGLLDDGTGGQVYIYVGTKTSTGNEIEKAGLTNGKLYGILVNGFNIERINSTTINNPPAAGTAFTLVDMGSVTNLSGATLNTNSVSAGVTSFSRPEDGAWDPMHPADFYFNTTDQLDQVYDGVGSQIGRSRVWRLRFTDINNPELGGTIEAVLDGTEGQVMLDNMAIDNYGHILLQEDVGNSVHNGKIWQYTIATDALTLLAKHDINRFGDIGIPATAPFNVDEESSGIIDVQSILGPGKFILTNQSHYSIPGELVEGGQLLTLFNPDTYNSSLLILSATKSNVNCYGGSNGTIDLSVTGGSSPYTYLWNNGATSEDINSLTAGTYTVTVTDNFGTTNTLTASVTQPTALALSIVAQPAPCGSNIGFATANPSGGTPKKFPTNPTYNYLWSDGRSLKAIGGLYPGTYTVTVTDSLGCSVTGSTVIVNTAITSVTTTSSKAKCGLNNGEACVTSINGGLAPFTYEWNTNPVQTLACATGLAKGTYEVTIRTAENCIHIEKVKVGSYKPLSVYIASSSCTKAKAQPVNGVYPFSYLWSNGATTKQVAGLSNGNYTVTVSDGNGCSASVSVTINCSSRELATSIESENGLTIAPNPVEDEFTIDFTSSQNSSTILTVTDLEGRIVLQNKINVIAGENSFNINVEELPTGIYSIHLNAGDTSINSKLIKK